MLFQSLSTLIWFLPVAAFLIVLYLLKIRRKDVRVPATFLWPAVTTDVRANALFQRLRPNLLLFLQLLIALLVIGALARPMMKSHGILGNATVIVLDSSASMSATDVSPSRFEAARSRIASLVRSMSPQDQLAIIEAGADTRVVASLTSDKKRLQEAVRSLRLSDAPNNIGDALRLATALVGNREGSKIVLLSDGAFPDVMDFSPGKAEFLFEAFGSRSDNVAITAVEMEETTNGKQLFVSIKNEGPKKMKGTLSFFVEGNLIDAREIEFGAGDLKGETLNFVADVRQVEVKLEADDLLKSDNEAMMIGSGQRVVRVLLVGPGNFYLERALMLEPNVQVDKTDAVPDSEKQEPGSRSQTGRYDLVIFDGVPPVSVKANSLVLINTTSPDGPVHQAGDSAIKTPQITTWDREHPVMRYVDMAGLLIDSSKKVQETAWGKVLLESKETPLIVSGQNKGKKWVYIGWNLMESDFPVRPGFPIFVANMLKWTTGDRPAEQGFTLRAGTPVSLALPGSETQFIMKTPDGREQSLEVLDGTLVVRGADKVGRYELLGSNLRIPFAVNLLNHDESNIAPRTTFQMGGKSVVAKGQSSTMRELWKPLALLALIILAVEWWIFIKRS